MPKSKQEVIKEVKKDFINMNDKDFPTFQIMDQESKMKISWGGRTKQGYIHYDTPTGKISLPIK